jgi:hypothetical protein
LKYVFNSPCHAPKTATEQRESIEVFAKILYKMNIASETETNWCQLVVIKFNQHSFDDTALFQ